MAAITIQVLRLSRSVITDAGVALAAGLAPRWSLTAGRTLGLAGTLCDTFDWKLYGEGMTLVDRAGELQLRKLSDGSLVASARAAAIPGLAADLPIGSLRKSLGSVARERALLPRTRHRLQVQCHRILNEDAKTIAQAYLHPTTEHAHRGDAEARCEVMLQSLRGYETETGRAAAALVAAGWTQTSLEQVYLETMRSAGLEPGGYSSALEIHLDPGMRSDAAVRVILRALLQMVRANAPYITADIDLEFVHDYRVALRRMRAALGEMRQVFTAEETTKVRRDLAAIARSTNEVRDLDVYLHAKDEYIARLPRDLRKDIAPLFELLSTKRSAALEDLKSFAYSPVPDRILGGLDTFLSASSQGADAGPEGHRPIGELAREIIHRRNKRLIQHGRRIHRDSPDAFLHQLRIDGKRLRYLMEFFSTLFDARLLRRLIKRLKRLQDILGEFNDGAVQQAYLWARAEELSASRPEARRTLLAVGSLISHLDAQQQRARSAFERAFAEYSGPENQRSFRELLNTTEK